MGSTRLHARLLAALLFILGGGSMLYQILVQKVPLYQDETAPVWTIDAQVDLEASDDVPVKLRMFVPPLDGNFTRLNENFISNDYGIKVNRDGENRRVTWSSRRGKGAETLYYRLTITPRYTDNTSEQEEGPQFRISPALEGPEQIAAEALLKPIRQHSADVETFISETIKKVNETGDHNVRLLLDGDASPENRARVATLLLAEANIPVQPVHTLRLANTSNQQLELWLRSYNGEQWLYFNPDDGREGLPEDRLVWWFGKQPLLTLDGGRDAAISFSVRHSNVGAMELAHTLHDQDQRSFIDTSFYSVPIPTQQLLMVILMIPVGVMLVLLIRSVIGVETLGTFTPVLIALAFRATEVVWGVLLFVGITSLGLLVRSYLEHLRLQFLARLSVMLTFVVMLMAGISLMSYKAGVTTGLSVGLFPMVILTMVIERVSIAWEERGAGHSIKLAVATLLTAIVCHALMAWEFLIYLVFTFPGILLMLASLMVLAGHYRGYRLLELLRFRELAEEGG